MADPYEGQKVRLGGSALPRRRELVPLSGADTEIVFKFPVGIRLKASENRNIKVTNSGGGTVILPWDYTNPDDWVGDFASIHDDSDTTAADGEVWIYHDQKESALPDPA